MSPRPLAIIGCGQIVTHHCTALAALPRDRSTCAFRIVALCDPSPDRRRAISEQLQQPSSSHLLHGKVTDDESATVRPPAEFTCLEDLLADPNIAKVKPAVFVSVPHDLHVRLATQALDAGLDVVMEKPLAPSIEGCRSLLDIADKSRGMLIISEQSPYWQEVAKARSLLEEGAIGTLISAASYYYESMRDNVTSGLDAAGGLGWRTSLKRAGGGVVVDGGLHWIRPLREFCGDVEEVVGVCRNAEAGLGMEGETLAHALLRMKRDDNTAGTCGNDSYGFRAQPPESGQLIATFSANMMHTAPMAHDVCPYFRLTGTKGELVIYGTGLNANGGGGLKLYNEDSPTGIDLFPKDRQGGFFLGFRGIWDVVSDILRTDDRARARDTVRNAAADVGVALALYKSSNSGRWEPCEQFLP